jgi:hypothetical protein
VALSFGTFSWDPGISQGQLEAPMYAVLISDQEKTVDESPWQEVIYTENRKRAEAWASEHYRMCYRRVRIIDDDACELIMDKGFAEVSSFERMCTDEQRRELQVRRDQLKRRTHRYSGLGW